MAELAVVVIFGFFGLVGLAVTYAWIVMPALFVAWLLLLVPPSTWTKLRTSVQNGITRLRRVGRSPSTLIKRRVGAHA